MDTSASSLREQGIQALRQGNPDGAVDLLARAVMADSQDADAQAFLGVAYSQKGLHAQAKRALQTAVELQPRNPGFQFNLGVALEQSGDQAGAASAYRAALQLNPEHAQARARLQVLGSPPPGAPTGAAAAAPLSPQQPPAAASQPNAPWLAGKDPPSAVPGVAPPGTVQCPNCKQWSKPGLSCEWCSAPLKSAPTPSSAPWLQSTYTSAAENAPRDSGYSVTPEMTAGDAFGRRFAASFIDGLIINVLSFFVGALIGVGSVATGTAGLGGRPNPGTGLAFMSGLVLSIAYYGGMLAARGQTLGKMALGLRVVGPDGGNPSFLRAVLRETIGKFISGIVLCLGYLWMLWDEGQQTWHDKIAGTYVERA